MTNHDGTITLTIREYMDHGLSVFDVNSKKIGTVYDYDRTTGYMEDDSHAITTEPSGYDGATVVVDDVAVGKLAHHIAPGFRVLSSEAKVLGTVAQYDRTIGQMLIRSSRASRRALTVPIAFLDFVDREDRVIFLSVSAADLARHPTVELDKQESNEVVVEAEVTEP